MPAALIIFFAIATAQADTEVDNREKSEKSEQGDKLELSFGRSYNTMASTSGLSIEPHWLPYLDANYNNRNFFASLQTGVGYKFINTEPFNLGLVVNYQYGRRQSTDRHYRSLGDIGGAAAPGFFIEYLPFGGALDLYGQTTRSIGATNAWNYLLDSNAGIPLTTRIDMFIDITAFGGDPRYTQHFYGVTAQQATASGYTEYKPSASLSSITTVLGLQYHYSAHWLLTADIGRLHYVGAVADSPLIDRSAYTVATVFATYRF